MSTASSIQANGSSKCAAISLVEGFDGKLTVMRLPLYCGYNE
jgi:hypothetical protein